MSSKENEEDEKVFIIFMGERDSTPLVAESEDFVDENSERDLSHKTVAATTTSIVRSGVERKDEK